MTVTTLMATRRIKRTSNVRLKSGKRSGFEDKIAADLDARGIDYEYEKLKVDFTPPPKKKRYTPDFTSIRLPPNVVIEAKGYFTSKDRSKHLDIQASRPDIEVRFVFQNASKKLSKTSKTTYADWCRKKGFRWAEGRIPEEWFSEAKRTRPKPH
jgi:hypothetical protein